MPQLVRNVYVGQRYVDGAWFGPDHGNVEPPQEIAEQITNPAAWDVAPEWAVEGTEYLGTEWRANAFPTPLPGYPTS